jgi:signal transduction histidine kinase
MPLGSDEQRVRVQLRRYLGARLGPLALFLVVVICLSAPVAYYVLGRRALRVQAEVTAAQVADAIAEDAQQRPRLWPYDSLKLLAHVRAYEVYEGIERIDVVDVHGRRIDPAQDGVTQISDRPVVWQRAPILIGSNPVGEVWVAVATSELRRDALLLLGAFGVLGAVLGGLMYWLPMRAMSRAQTQIGGLLRRLEESQLALAVLNENLEHQVEARSSELRQAYRELQDKEQNLRELSSRAVGLQEAERRGIARELHDSAGQSLTAIRIHLQLISNLLAAEIEEAQMSRLEELARRTTQMVDDTVEEIRRAVNQLGPAVLDDVGLREAIERAAEDAADALGIVVECEIELPGELEASVETTGYRLIQEALTNVARHAAASRVEVEVRPGPGRLEIRIEDDGQGFDPAARTEKSRGLVGMRERVELLGGTLTIHSAPGEGTRIEAEIPAGGGKPTDSGPGAC